MKRALTLLLALALLLGLCLPAGAAEDRAAQLLALAKEAVRNWESELDLSDWDFSTAEAAEAMKLLADDPELFYYDHSVTWFYGTEDNGQVTRLEFIYHDCFTPADTEVFEAAVNRALGCLIPGMNALQTALVLHDYLAVQTAYDIENVRAGTIPDASFTAYGALVLGKAVCQGYAQAYRVLLGRCGIPTAYVPSEGMNHGWTLVKLGESWYHADVTWDDPTPDTPGLARHDFFLRSDSAVAAGDPAHYGWDAPFACTDTRFDTDKFWMPAASPIPFTDRDTCWLLTEQGDYQDQSLSLVRRSWSTGETAVVGSVRDYWPVWGKDSSYWLDAYSGLVLWDGRLFFNDRQNVYAYDPGEESFAAAFTYSGGDGYLYGMTGDGENLYCLVKRDPGEEGRSLPLSLERVNGSGPFTDIPVWAYYRKAVVWAYENEVTKGTADTLFSPMAACTRGQVVTFLWRAMGRPAPQNGENPFADVPEGAYYRDAVLWAVEQGITNGTGTDGETGKALFSPDADCSYAHILTFLWRTLTGNGASSYGSWYSEALDWAGSLLADTAPGEDAARVTENCPRCDVVTYLWRALADVG